MLGFPIILATFADIMTHQSAIFPNEIYLNGLQDSDAAVVETLYNEFRQPIVRAVEMAGGSYADGAAFFRVAIIQTAQLIRSGAYPGETPVFLFLKNLAIAQYRDWLFEKGQDLPPMPELSADELEIVRSLPNHDALEEIRQMVSAKRQFTRLEMQDAELVQQLAERIADKGMDAEVLLSSAQKSSLESYKKLMEKHTKVWEEPMPAWCVLALTDSSLHQIWSVCEAIERRLARSQVPEKGDNKTLRYAFFAFLALTIGYAFFSWVFRDRTPAEVYDNNFNPPASIVADLQMRYADDSAAMFRPEYCNLVFEKADGHYKRKEWREAARELADLMEGAYSDCQSDALYYLAIIGLQLDRPELTLEFIAKMEDLERYGEEIYWYMALAYVKVAANDPTEKDIARRAVERALSNSEIPERRKQAEKMLEDLSK